MTTPSLTVLLPEDHPEAWADELLEQLKPALALLADRCCVAAPILAVKRNGDHFVLLSGENRYALPPEPSPARLTSSLCDVLNDHLWETIHAPAFSARGGSKPYGFWIRHAADRGLTFVLALGVRWSPIPTLQELEWALLLRAGCFIDPALVLALCTDQKHIGRRLAVRAMQGDTPVRIAERLIHQHRRFAACLIHQPPIPSPIDIALTIEEELGLRTQA